MIIVFEPDVFPYFFQQLQPRNSGFLGNKIPTPRRYCGEPVKRGRRWRSLYLQQCSECKSRWSIRGNWVQQQQQWPCHRCDGDGGDNSGGNHKPSCGNAHKLARKWQQEKERRKGECCTVCGRSSLYKHEEVSQQRVKKMGTEEQSDNKCIPKHSYWVAIKCFVGCKT